MRKGVIGRVGLLGIIGSLGRVGLLGIIGSLGIVGLLGIIGIIGIMGIVGLIGKAKKLDLLLNSLLVAAAALVVHRVESPPLALNTLVAFHLDLAFTPFEAIVDVAGNEVGEEKSVGTLGAILRENAKEQQVDALRLMELTRTENMPPAERQ